MKVTKKVRVGSTFYNVRYSKEVLNEKGKSLLGDIDYKQRIRISTDCPHQRQLQTLFHESTHGISEEWYLGFDEQEVTIVSNAVYSFIIDNPEYIREILRVNKEQAKPKKVIKKD